MHGPPANTFTICNETQEQIEGVEVTSILISDEALSFYVDRSGPKRIESDRAAVSAYGQGEDAQRGGRFERTFCTRRRIRRQLSTCLLGILPRRSSNALLETW